VKDGLTTGKDEAAGKILQEKHIRIMINLRMGTAFANVLTCDMTEGYIRVNAAYRT
jgi:glutamate N-acetyltransferase/amino-acid N-acetyltransferase